MCIIRVQNAGLSSLDVAATPGSRSFLRARPTSTVSRIVNALALAPPGTPPKSLSVDRPARGLPLSPAAVVSGGSSAQRTVVSVEELSIVGAEPLPVPAWGLPDQGNSLPRRVIDTLLKLPLRWEAAHVEPGAVGRCADCVFYSVLSCSALCESQHFHGAPSRRSVCLNIPRSEFFLKMGEVMTLCDLADAQLRRSADLRKRFPNEAYSEENKR